MEAAAVEQEAERSAEPAAAVDEPAPSPTPPDQPPAKRRRSRIGRIKLRHPGLIRFLALLAAWLLRVWLSTVRVRMHADDPSVPPARMRPRRAVYLFWHEMMLLPACTYAHQGISVLISQHADGELIARILKMMGFGAVRGSTSKQGLSALRGLIRRGKLQHLGITPDGPRGPRRVVQPGAVYVASRTGMPLVPAGFAFHNCWRHRSWDRMAFPKPFTAAEVVAGRPIFVPPDLGRDGLEEYRLRVQAALDEVQERAERRAAAAHANVNPVNSSRIE